MTTALFGGSFDPVHKGHRNVVESLLREIPDIERVIIMPAHVNPFKSDDDRSGRAADEQRLEMCRLAFGDIPQCIVSDFEIRQGGLSYTVLTLEHLAAVYPRDRLILTVGSDSLESLPTWYRFGDIAKMADIAAVSRSDADSMRIEENAVRVRAAGGRVTVIPAKPFDISSTAIRKKIFNNEEITCYIDKNVVKYIMSENIYR